MQNGNPFSMQSFWGGGIIPFSSLDQSRASPAHPKPKKRPELLG